MAFTSRKSEIFPYPFDRAFNAVCAICKEFDWNIRESDLKSGHITAMVFTSTLSWGEEVSIDLNRVGEKETSVCVKSKSSGSIFSPIKNRMNIKKLFEELERSLKSA